MKILWSFIILLIFSINAYANLSLQKSAENSIYQSIYKINQLSHLNYPRPVMQKFIKEQILPLFAFEYMSKKILEKVPNSQQKIWLIDKIKVDVVSSILQNLFKIKGRFLTPIGTKAFGDDIIVRLRVKNINIDLVMRMINNNWKISDVAINGQSLIYYYKTVFFRKFRI